MRGDPLPVHGRRRLQVVPYLATAAVITFLWRHVLFARALIESGDLLTPLTMPALRRMFWPFWNRTLEFPNIETVDRLAWMAPFLLLPNPLLAQNLMIAVAVVGAGLSMLYAARRLGAPLLLAVGAAVLFAYNPFVAVRLQHYFQLPGYAVLPAVVALWLKPYPRRTPLILALLLTLGSSTPHYTVYLWSLGALWLVFFFNPAALRRFVATLGLYLLFNLYWLVPTAAFTRAVDLVPSRPTWELLELFSRHATHAAVARLQGYWWPLADIAVAPVTAWLGWGLLAAALLALVRPERERLFLGVAALVYGLVALGTRVPFLASFLSLESPVADRFGWLFRDPAKAVGPLASLLFLLAVVGWQSAAHKPNTLRLALSLGLLSAYGVFALAVTGPYLRAVYQAHAPPAAFLEANEWLAGKDGRALWLPQYYGATTFWNGDNLTPEFPTHSSALPVLGPYGYDGRSVVSYLSLYFGVLLRRTDADLSKVLRAWGTRWLVHHRDLPPYRLQPPGAFDNQVELLPPSLASQALTEAATFSPLSIYDAGAPVGAYLPGRVSVTDNPVAALVTLSNWRAYEPERWSFVEAPHAGVQDVTLAPGGDARVVLAPGYRVDLAQATVHYDPEHRWSRLGETTLEWWPHALPTGLPADETVTLLMTRAPGAQAEVRANVPADAYRLLVRAYQGPEAGALRLELGTKTYTVELFAPSLRSAWLDLGALDLGALDLETDPNITLTNLDGFNVLAEVKLVPVAAWAAAETALAGLEQTWLWPSSTLCRDLQPSEAAPMTVSAEERALPFAQTFGGASLWNDYRTVALDLYGDGQDRPVELWTQVGDTWLFLGGTRTWWRGWRTVHIPVRAQDFVFVASGSFAPATNLKFVTPDEGEGGAALRVREVRLTSSPSCYLQFSSGRAVTATLSLSAERPINLKINGQPLSVNDEVPTKVDLRAGTNTLEFSLADVGTVRGVVVTTGDAMFGTPGTPLAETALETEVVCSDTWQLVVTTPFYLPGKPGRLQGARLEAEPVNYLRAGYWLSPDTCGSLRVGNVWIRLGWASLVASVLSLVAVLSWYALQNRVTRERRADNVFWGKER